MSTSLKILRYPYEKEYVLSVIEDCFAYLDSYLLINDIKFINTPINMPLNFIFANNPPSAWLEKIINFLESNSYEDFFVAMTPNVLRNTLNQIKKEVLASE